MSHVIVFQGDSITDGNRTKNPDGFWDLNHYLGHGYAQMAAARLGAEYPEADYIAHNRGLSGNRILDIYARWKEDAINLRPDTISLLAGVNDSGAEVDRQAGSRADRFERILRMMLDEAREALPQVRLILMEPFLLPVKGKAADQFEQRYAVLEGIQRVLPTVARDYGAAFVPLQNTFEALCSRREASWWLWDGVHPTAAGHEIITRAWMDAFLGK